MSAWFSLLIRRRWLVLAVALAGAAGGLANLRGLSVDAVPDISPKQVMILTQSPGLGPLEVERLVSFPVENAMAGAPGLTGIRSTSRAGVSAVYVTFDDGVPVTEARAQVFQRLPAAKAMMPAGVGDPQMGPMATGLGEIYQFELRGPAYSPMELKRILQWTVAPRLKLTPGIADVNIYGGQLPTYEARVSSDALRRYGITLGQVYAALSENNLARGGAYIEHNDQQQTIRGLGLAKGPSDIAGIVVATNAGGLPVTVADLGEVVEAPKVRLGAVSHDAGGETVVGIAMMQQGENASAVVERVKATVEELSPQLPPGVEIKPYYDRSTLVERTIRTVEHNLVEGAALVVAVLLLLLGNLRAGLVVAAAIPLSMLMAFAGMRFLGLSGNLMSLGAIDFGLIVDGAVVMVENVLRARGEHPDRPPFEVIRDAAAEVAKPILFAVAIIMLVYVPVLALEGVAGKMFRPMAVTVILALAGSLVLTMTLMPALAAIMLSGSGVGERETRLVRAMRATYEPVLRVAERRSGVTVLVTLVLFAGSCLLATRLGGEFLPKLSEGSIVVTSEKLPGINLDASLMAVNRIESVLKSFPEVKRVVSLTGSAEIPTDPMGVESTDSFIALTDPSTWTTAETQEGLVAAFEARLRAKVPGVAYSFSQPIQMRMDDLLEGVRGDVAISLYGDDLEVLKDRADAIVRAVSGVRGAADVKAEAQAGMPAVTIQVDRAAAARYGVSASDILDVVEAVGGRSSGMVYREDNAITDIVVRLDAGDRGDVGRIRSLPVGRAGRPLVPLSEVATVEAGTGPAQISRERLQRRISVQANVRGRDVQGFVAEAREAVRSQVSLPPRYALRWSGQFQNLQEATSRLSVVVPAAMAAILLLLVVMFGDLRIAGLIFLNVPVAATGGIVALYLRGLPFSVSAAVGFIATFGIAVLNGVVLASYIRDLERSGLSPEAAAMQAARMRLRPVMTTALVATLGFLPMALSTSAGAEVQRPLATVVIGGLLTATLLTLVVLPAVYPFVSKLRWPGAKAVAKEGRSPLPAGRVSVDA
ncbi:efflux RND transporter permease subunit [Methylobacterium radiotolerans]|jgi:heavy metal efflux system protein|uniref:efflux RND transporter permease subunit n=1 Tax=Methylobacterium TaxID=407 RepID=UPI0005E03B2E|nr:MULTISPECIES: CusA/CzcA family heavy metal efflux RND transporter [Methylobacterium]MBN6820598.1 efflux RND transporter permease subunit [Methylobacterium organophilum]OXE41444.1 CusA/CzcA family heavy metal efflux RND transporter [Methylobacterium radiotolerans]GAN48034.1 heavy metal efflux pump, CzcA family [Methylobacterium sp. ME121]